MTSRFFTNISLAILAGFLVVASLALPFTPAMWIMFGVGAVAVLLTAAAFLPGRGLAQRALDGTIGTLGAWTVVASLVFAGSTVTWLGFASGVALVGLAVTGLILHEISTERVVHSLEVRTAPMTEREYAGIN